MSEISHERCSELLGAYVAGRLDASEQAAVDEHVSSCADCAAELVAVRALSSPHDEALTEHERARLERGIAWELGDMIPARGERSRTWTRVAQALGAAALLAIVGVGVVQLGTGGGGENASTAAGNGGGKAQNDSVRGSAGGSTAETGANADLAPIAHPVFQRHTLALTDKKLAHLGKSSEQFHSFTEFSSAEADRLQNDYVDELANEAPTSSQGDQVRRCSDQVFASTGSYSLLPAYAAGARLDGKDALVLGFAWTDRPKGPLDKYMLWVWPVADCSDVPLDYSAGEIGKK